MNVMLIVTIVLVLIFIGLGVLYYFADKSMKNYFKNK